MKTITVDFTSDNPIQPFYGGEFGENRAVQLNVIPSTDMSEDENLAIYYVAFTVEGGVILSESFNQGEDISVSLGSVITEQRKVFFQLIATSTDGESVISKSPVVMLFLGKSIEGEIIPDPESGDTIYTELAELKAMIEQINGVADVQDSEGNSIVDPETKIATLPEYESNIVDVQDEEGNSLVNAEKIAIVPAGGAVNDVQDAEGNSLVVDKIATLPVIPEYGKMFEIVDYTEGGNTYIKYTGSELYDLINDINRDTVYCYYGKPIQYCRFVASDDHRFAVLTAGISTLPSVLEYRLNGKRVVSSQNYGWASETPYTVNEKIKLSLIEERAQKNVQPDWNQTDTTADDFIKNKPSGKWALIAQKTLAETSSIIGIEDIGKGITDFVIVIEVQKPTSAVTMNLWIGTSFNDETQIATRALGTSATALEIIDVILLPGVACEARGLHHNTINQGGTTAMTAYANCNTYETSLPTEIRAVDVSFNVNVNAGTKISIFAKN